MASSFATLRLPVTIRHLTNSLSRSSCPTRSFTAAASFSPSRLVSTRSNLFPSQPISLSRTKSKAFHSSSTSSSWATGKEDVFGIAANQSSTRIIVRQLKQQQSSNLTKRWISRSTRSERAELAIPLSPESIHHTQSFPVNSTTTTTFDTESASVPLPTLTTPAVATWLYASSAVVLFIVIVGGVTRLTESGLSITEWEPVKGILPPIGEEQWQVEWEKYKVTPEGILTNSQLDMSSFKSIFLMEWAHRLAGRALGVGFILPAAYFLIKGKVGKGTRWKLGAIGLGIGFQGLLGWYMVKSGLSDDLLTTPGAVPRVSQYRLAAHLGAAFLLYIGMLHTAFTVSRDWKFAHPELFEKVGGMGMNQVREALERKEVRRFAGWGKVVAGMVLFTAVSGAFVAGLDAGLIYNEFPLMGGRIMPPTEELMDSRYATTSTDKWWRNMLENPTTVQFDHRAFATTTFLAILSLPFLATRPGLKSLLPPSSRKWAKSAMHMAFLQVSMGISTLIYLVPVPLAAAHQAGSVVLMTMMLGLVTSLRRPGKIARIWAESKGRGKVMAKSITRNQVQ